MLELQEKDFHSLLARPTHVLAPEALRFCVGKRILVTGAGGSIGSQLVRLLVGMAEPPTRILLFESSEIALYQIQEEILAHYPLASIQGVLGSILDERLLFSVMQGVDIVFHCAAYKHVPMIEAHPIQGVVTNAYGTYRCVVAAEHCEVERFVLISTDKAVAPTSVMGASKRVAEMVTLAFAASTAETWFNVVRFGNVLGSSGSVVPKFIQQVRAGVPLTITDPLMTRYFMSIPEACCLILEAASLPANGEIHILDMGEPIKISDLAHRLALAMGAPDHPIQITGMRPGEKLHEQLSLQGTQPTTLPGILRVQQQPRQWGEFSADLLRLFVAARVGDEQETFATLHTLVPEFQHASHL
ncbi:MAG: polysaccharide biosynthesis protein [Stenomitos frigidus ULC029]